MKHCCHLCIPINTIYKINLVVYFFLSFTDETQGVNQAVFSLFGVCTGLKY